MVRKTKLDFSKPTEISDAQIIFPASIQNLMPEYKDIPNEFNMYHGKSPFCKLQSKWFFEGLRVEEIPPVKPGIDKTTALRHLSAIQGSFEPKHEHKCAAVSYLMSLWFEDPTKK